MTAFDLIDSIFSRVQGGMPSNVRRVTAQQFAYLRDLIDRDPEGGAVHKGMNGSIIWMPSGRTKYVLTEDPAGSRSTIAKLQNITASDCGRLF